MVIVSLEVRLDLIAIPSANEALLSQPLAWIHPIGIRHGSRQDKPEHSTRAKEEAQTEQGSKAEAEEVSRRQMAELSNR